MKWLMIEWTKNEAGEKARKTHLHVDSITRVDCECMFKYDKGFTRFRIWTFRDIAVVVNKNEVKNFKDIKDALAVILA